jgi:cleavage and polyadenylation specificity factor subunit 2
VEELEALPKPLVVLATTASLEWGFARDLFVEWSSNPRHAVIFTDRPQPGTLGHLVLTQQPPALGLEVQPPSPHQQLQRFCKYFILNID